MAEPLPFVAEPPGDLAITQAAADAAAAEWGLPAPQHLRTGMNALFTCGDEIVLRVARTTAPVEQALWLMERLAAEGVRVPRPAIPGAVHRGDLSVLAIERLHPRGAVDWAAVGAMVARTHRIAVDDVAAHYPLPFCGSFPHWRVEVLREEIDDLLDAPARAALDAALARCEGWRDRIAAAPEVFCHGDIHPGNVVQTESGPVLLDWDLACHGPAAWDHAAVMTWTERWDGVPGLYEAFAAGFGRSLRGDPVGDLLAEMRLLVATMMRVRAGRTNPDAAEEARRRLRYWLGDPAAPRWRPA